MSRDLGHSVHDTASSTILVVDDEATVRDLITRWLTSEGYRCLQASDVPSAWKCLCENDVHLVTLDINMPGISGMDLLFNIKSMCLDTEVIMLTARGETAFAIEAFTRGASGYLLKPVEYDSLLFQVHKGLEHRQLILERRQYTQQLEDKVQEQTLAIRRAHEETIHRLVNASMYRDEETGSHIKRVGLYCEQMAKVLGWSPDDVEMIRMAAPMHDVGKIGIPDAILQKPGRLSDAEFEVMKTHTTIGARMLAGSDSPMLQMAEEIALSHHERWDGGGYPHGASGLSIPEVARIVAIVDVYDAISHDRVYRPALPEKEVLRIIKQGRGSHFDPDVVDIFFSTLPTIQDLGRQYPDERGARCGNVELFPSGIEMSPAAWPTALPV